MQQVPCLQLTAQVRLKRCQTPAAWEAPRRLSTLSAPLPDLSFQQ